MNEHWLAGSNHSSRATSRVPLLLLLTLVVTALVGCGGGNAKEADNSVPSPPQAEESRIDHAEAAALAKTLYEATSANYIDIYQANVGGEVRISGELADVSNDLSAFESAVRLSRVQWDFKTNKLTYVAWVFPEWGGGSKRLAQEPWIRETQFFVLVTEEQAKAMKRGEAYSSKLRVVAVGGGPGEPSVFLEAVGN